LIVCLKRHREHLSNCVISKTLKHIVGSIMVYGCMSWEGVREFTVIEGKLNNMHYHNILHDNLSMIVMNSQLEVEEWVFQHGNNPKHIRRSTNKWFIDPTITILSWNPQSPDMNLVKHLLNKVDRRLQLHKDLPTHKDDLWR